jgi:hypothetical protein
MAYLFDTDTISAVLRPRPDLGVARRLATVAADEQFTSAITLGELLFGALRRQRADLLERIQAIADTVPVLPFHEAAGSLAAVRGRAPDTLADAVPPISLASRLRQLEGAAPYAPSLIAYSMTFPATARPSASPLSQALRKWIPAQMREALNSSARELKKWSSRGNKYASVAAAAPAVPVCPDG